MPKQVKEQAKAVNNSAPREGKTKMSSKGMQDRPTKNASRGVSSNKRSSSSSKK